MNNKCLLKRLSNISNSTQQQSKRIEELISHEIESGTNPHVLIAILYTSRDLDRLSKLLRSVFANMDELDLKNKVD